METLISFLAVTIVDMLFQGAIFAILAALVIIGYYSVNYINEHLKSYRNKSLVNNFYKEKAK